MEPVAGLLGLVTGALGVILTLGTIRKRAVTWVQDAVRDVLVDSGLIKRGKRQETWPNGSDTLPDFLDHLWAKIGEGDVPR